MKNAQLLTTDGTVTDIAPANGKDFKLKELYALVGSPVDFARLPSGRVMVVNDNGKLTGLPVNLQASRVWQHEYPIEKYPHNNDQTIVGDVIVCDSKMVL